MRALSRDEQAFLQGEHIGLLFSDAEAEGIRLMAIADSLVERGCLIRYRCAPGELGHSLTPLGRLALRVSRPEMAVPL
jgi:hypothetical protein